MRTPFTLLILIFVSNAFAQIQMEEGELAGIKYQVETTERNVYLTLPYKVRVNVSRNDKFWSKKYYAIVSGSIDTEAPEIEQVRKKYPGYDIKVLSPQRFQKVDIDFGVSLKEKVVLQTPPLNAENFMAYAVLSDDEGQHVVDRLKKGEKPKVTVQVSFNQPVVKDDGSFIFRSKDVCVSTYASQNLGSALAKLMLSLNKTLAGVASERLHRKVTLNALETCLAIDSEIFAKDMRDLLGKRFSYGRVPDIQETLRAVVVSYKLSEKEWPLNLDVEVK